MTLARTKIAAACWLLLASLATAQPVWNIAEHGATPDRDCSAIVNYGLATQHDHGLPVVAPHGRWKLAQTIIMPRREGGCLIGAGAVRQFKNNDLRGIGSSFEWVGEQGLPMLEMRGSGAYVAGLGFHGLPRVPTHENARAAMGILITKRGGGIGTGKHEFERVVINSCEVGLQCGRTLGEHNNDGLGWKRLTINNCGVAYRVLNSQSMEHSIERLAIHKTPIAFDFQAGGILHVDGCLAFQTLLLRLGERGGGRNNGLFSFTGLKVDAQHYTQSDAQKEAGTFSSFQLLDSQDKASATVIVRESLISGKNPWRIGRVGKFVQVRMIDSQSPAQFVTADMRDRRQVNLVRTWFRGITCERPTSPMAPSEVLEAK